MERTQRKVIIADDEDLICQMIVKIVDWQAKGMIVSGTANDGITVLNMIQAQHPDILITDIRMPGLDGLELIRKAQEIDEDLSFIIISGYRSFDYAHTALTLGVNHYLLKPISEKELNETLDQINQEKDKKEHREEESRNTILEETRKESRRHFLTDIIHKHTVIHDGTQAADGEDADRSQAALPADKESYRGLYIKVDTTGENYRNLGTLQHIEEQVFSSWPCEYLNNLVRSGIVSVLSYDTERDKDIKRLTDILLERLQHEVEKFEDCTVTIGVGEEVHSIRDVEKSMKQAVIAIKCRIRKGCGRVIFYEALSYPASDISGYLTRSRRLQIEQFAESLDIRAIQDELHEFNIYIRQKTYYNPEEIFDYLEEVEAAIRKVLGNNGVSEEELDQFHLRSEEVQDSQTTLDSLLFMFGNACAALFSKILDDRKQAENLPVRKARQYLENHYNEDVTLDEVAQAVGWSSAYLSAQFSKITGVGFNDYLTFLRMEKAKDFLKKTDEPVTQIAQDVGYMDHRYFSRVFRKTVGLKPSEYRKLYQ